MSSADEDLFNAEFVAELWQRGETEDAAEYYCALPDEEQDRISTLLTSEDCLELCRAVVRAAHTWFRTQAYEVVGLDSADRADAIEQLAEAEDTGRMLGLDLGRDRPAKA